MPDLLANIPTGIVTSEQPKTAITPGLIQQQSNARAEAIDKEAGAAGKIADNLMDVSTDLAKKQAADDLMHQKVTRDASGNVTVENPATAPLIFGRAGEAYSDAVRTGTLAQQSNSLSQDFAELHAKYPTDPHAFRAAAQAHLDKTAQTVTGPLGEAIQRDGAQLLTQHFNAITSATASKEVAIQSSAISATQTSALNDATAMVRGGASIADPAVQDKFAQWDAAAQQRLKNPLFGYSREQYQLDAAQFHSEVAGGRFLYETDRLYKNPADGGGYAGAMKFAEGILSDPRYQLSQAQREQFYHRAIADVRANEALRHQSIGEARAAFSELQMVSATGGRVGTDLVENTAKAFTAAGDPGGAARVYAAFARKPLNDSFGKQPLSEQVSQLAALHGANAVSAVYSGLLGMGYSREVAAGIAGHVAIESGGDPNAVGDGGTSGGLVQFHNERLTALKAFAAARGKPASDLQTQLQFIDHELRTTEAPTMAKLQAAKTPEEAAHAFMDYERPKGWTPQNPQGGLGYADRVAVARAVYDGKPTGASTPAGAAWLEANRQRTVSSAAQTQWHTVMKDYDTEQTRPSVATVSDVVKAAHLTGDTALLEQIAHDTQRMDFVRAAGQAPLPDQEANIAAFNAAGHAGQLPPGVSAVQKDLQRRHDAIVTGLDKNPVATTVDNFSDKLKAPPPLDLSSTDALAQTLQARSKIVQFAAGNWKTPALSALDADEVKQVQAVLASPDPAAKLRVFSAIGTLPEDIRGATLSKLGKDGPLSATEVFAGSLVNEAPQVAAGILVGLKATDADKRLMPTKDANKLNYQTAKDTFLPMSAFNMTARTNPTGSYATMSQAIDARYAALSAEASDTSGSVNSKQLQQAVQDVTGGVLYHNGAAVIAPARNMTQRQFDGVMAGITDADVADMTTANGKPIGADYLRSSAKLHALASGRYLVQVNADDGNPKYAQGRDGRAYVLDLRNRTQAPIESVAPSLSMALP